MAWAVLHLEISGKLRAHFVRVLSFCRKIMHVFVIFLFLIFV